MISIFLVIILYVASSFSVFGNLTSDEVIAAKSYAIAQLTASIFAQMGYTIVTIPALVLATSSINENLYAVTNVTYQLANGVELPSVFGKPIAHSHQGLR